MQYSRHTWLPRHSMTLGAIEMTKQPSSTSNRESTNSPNLHPTSGCRPRCNNNILYPSGMPIRAHLRIRTPCPTSQVLHGESYTGQASPRTPAQRTPARCSRTALVRTALLGTSKALPFLEAWKSATVLVCMSPFRKRRSLGCAGHTLLTC